ncbi:hypothetical protein KJ780_01830, partial [Candidatus Micrarchaeota archaeon]|nr:hypothetical protein [Candidatus Micrarchaeota archaeon]
ALFQPRSPIEPNPTISQEFYCSPNATLTEDNITIAEASTGNESKINFMAGERISVLKFKYGSEDNVSCAFNIDETVQLRLYEGSESYCIGPLLNNYELSGYGASSISMFAPYTNGSYEICQNSTRLKLITSTFNPSEQNYSLRIEISQQYLETAQGAQWNVPVFLTNPTTAHTMYANLTLKRWRDDLHTEELPIPSTIYLNQSSITIPANSTVQIQIVVNNIPSNESELFGIIIEGNVSYNPTTDAQSAALDIINLDLDPLPLCTQSVRPAAPFLDVSLPSGYNSTLETNYRDFTVRLSGFGVDQLWTEEEAEDSDCYTEYSQTPVNSRTVTIYEYVSQIVCTKRCSNGVCMEYANVSVPVPKEVKSTYCEDGGDPITIQKCTRKCILRCSNGICMRYGDVCSSESACYNPFEVCRPTSTGSRHLDLVDCGMLANGTFKLNEVVPLGPIEDPWSIWQDQEIETIRLSGIGFSMKNFERYFEDSGFYSLTYNFGGIPSSAIYNSWTRFNPAFRKVFNIPVAGFNTTVYIDAPDISLTQNESNISTIEMSHHSYVARTYNLTLERWLDDAHTIPMSIPSFVSLCNGNQVVILANGQYYTTLNHKHPAICVDNIYPEDDSYFWNGIVVKAVAADDETINNQDTFTVELNNWHSLKVLDDDSDSSSCVTYSSLAPGQTICDLGNIVLSGPTTQSDKKVVMKNIGVGSATNIMMNVSCDNRMCIFDDTCAVNSTCELSTTCKDGPTCNLNVSCGSSSCALLNNTCGSYSCTLDSTCAAGSCSLDVTCTNATDLACTYNYGPYNLPPSSFHPYGLCTSCLNTTISFTISENTTTECRKVTVNIQDEFNVSDSKECWFRLIQSGSAPLLVFDEIADRSSPINSTLNTSYIVRNLGGSAATQTYLSSQCDNVTCNVSLGPYSIPSPPSTSNYISTSALLDTSGTEVGSHLVNLSASDTPSAQNSSTAFTLDVYTCGDGICDIEGESCSSCPADCGVCTTPIISISNPQSIIYAVNTTPLNYTVSGVTYLGSCWYKLDGGVSNPLPNCTNTTLTNMREGEHSVNVFANDSWNNIGNSSVSFTINQNAPLVEIQSPTDRAYNDSNISINYTAWDSDGIDQCWYSIDLNSSIALPGCTNTTMPALSNGSHTIIISANDTLGNIGASAVSFRIGEEIPTLSISIQNPTNTTYNNTNISLNYTTTGASSCWYIMNSNPPLVLPSCTNTTFNATIGANNITVFANNTQGNITNSTVYFTVSTPEMGVMDVLPISPPDSYSTNQTTNTFTWKAVGSFQNASCQLIVD